MDKEEKRKFNNMLKLLLTSKVDCRRFNNIKMVFLSEDETGKCNLYSLKNYRKAK
jgi:hypothetical protein